MYVAIAESPVWMSAKEVGPFLLDDFLRGVMNKNDHVWLVHWRLVGVPNFPDIAMLDLKRPHTANRISRRSRQPSRWRWPASHPIDLLLSIRSDQRPCEADR